MITDEELTALEKIISQWWQDRCGPESVAMDYDVAIAALAKLRELRGREVTTKNMQPLLARHGYNYGEDAAENARVGYELAMRELRKQEPVAWAIFKPDGKIQVLVREQKRAEAWLEIYPDATITPLYAAMQEPQT